MEIKLLLILQFSTKILKWIGLKVLQSIFTIVPYHLYWKTFLLQCPLYTVTGKLIALTNYHNNHYFTGHFCKWNNGTHNSKSLCLENLNWDNILIVNQLIDKNGQLYS